MVLIGQFRCSLLPVCDQLPRLNDPAGVLFGHQITRTNHLGAHGVRFDAIGQAPGSNNPLLAGSEFHRIRPEQMCLVDLESFDRWLLVASVVTEVYDIGH